MKVLFLDIDGVLNNRRSMLAAVRGVYPPENNAIYTVDPTCVIRLRDALPPSTRIVVSSTWRYSKAPVVKNALEWAGWKDPPIIGRTRDGDGGKRGHEIEAWLRPYKVERYAIVDDNSDMLDHQLPYFVRTNFETGFTDEDARRLQRILG